MLQVGDRVKDPVTGFSGICMARHEYLHGCVRFTVQPVVDKEGKIQDSATFDEPQLELIDAGVIATTPVTADRPGGPDKYQDEGR